MNKKELKYYLPVFWSLIAALGFFANAASPLTGFAIVGEIPGTASAVFGILFTLLAVVILIIFSRKDNLIEDDKKELFQSNDNGDGLADESK